jgi:hypothetical protein
MKYSLLLLAGILLGLSLYSCEYNNEEDLYPGITCDTTQVTYSLTIAPLVAQHCLDLACHGGSADQSGLPFESYEGLKTAYTTGRLIGALRHQSGFAFMPKNTAALPECDILKFERWVAEGAPNN